MSTFAGVERVLWKARYSIVARNNPQNGWERVLVPHEKSNWLGAMGTREEIAMDGKRRRRTPHRNIFWDQRTFRTGFLKSPFNWSVNIVIFYFSFLRIVIV